MNPTQTDFDLLTDGWIAALHLNGDSVQLGILPLLERAGQFAAVADSSPLVTCGVYRLLLAITHAYLEVADPDDWEALWKAERFPESFLLRVAGECRGRLRLFDPERPFYQSGDLRLDGKPVEPLKSVGYLLAEASTGTNVAHFEHSGEAEHAFCPACCAQGLVQLPAFALAGGAGIKPGINGVPPLYVLPRGETLFHTLLLNYWLPAFRAAAAGDPDPGPLWNNSATVTARLEKDTTGFVESLTWPPRRVRLFPGPGGECSRCGQEAAVLVRRMIFAQGWSRRKELPLWRDPWAAYVPKSGSGNPVELVPVRPSEQKDVWRDFPSLFFQLDGHDTRRPQILGQLAELEGDVLPSRYPIRYEVFGLRTDMKAKVFEWRRDSFTFPTTLLRSAASQRAVRHALEYAAYVDTALLTGMKPLFAEAQAVSEALANARKTGKLGTPAATVDRNDPLVYGTRREFWSRLEPRFRQGLLDPRLVAGEQGIVPWSEAWCKDTAQIAGECMRRAVRAYDGMPEAVTRQVCALELFGKTVRIWKGGES